jgi:hypothetical protein
MGEKALVESLLDDAIALVKKLDGTQTPATFAAWYYYDDADEWRLLIASKELDALLPKQEAVAYRKVIDALSALPPVSLSVSDLKLVATSYPLLQALKFLVGTGPQAIVRAHFRDCTMNGIFIKEVVILRSA